MREVWKPICGYEGFYEVSNLGRVKSLWFRNNHSLIRRDKIMSTTDNGSGYKIVGLRLPLEKKRNFYVHRLVAEAFIDNPSDLPVIDHIDHDRGNNRADNLQWVTQRENVQRSVELMSHPRSVATTNTGHKYISKVKGGRYKVSLPWLKFWHSYETLDEAVQAKEVQLEKEGNAV